MLIGLTGLCCAGKNYIASLLETNGFSVLDVDKLGHNALDEAADSVFARWGSVVAGEDGRVLRKKLAELVFGKQSELAALEAIVHPVVNRHIEMWINEAAGKTRFINAALLHKCEAVKKLDAVIVVKAPFILRIIRAKKRDSISFCAILRRFIAQKSFYKHYKRLNKPLYFINNGFFKRSLCRSLDKLLISMQANKKTAA
ncbi:MAG: dephospho-CoA kinase [Spirochaetaceae bacterium]|jgi:dephospho-CoA kinase|nr:dephospho-CoA kinase [Spirochaetaceae bacterium]GMO30178.1 MAG: dephospho-CoA kinase [Termitinemataceae bacterium]